MSKKFVNFMESDVYGREEFFYDTAQEQMDGLRQLMAGARAGQTSDGIQRWVGCSAGPVDDADEDKEDS